MRAIKQASKGPDDGLIIHHFYVDQHRISLSQFTRTARASNDIVKCFNNIFFDGKARFELKVAAPGSGGLTEILVVVAGAVGLSYTMLKLLEDENVKAFIKGLTGHPPVHWSERLGEVTRKKIGFLDSSDDGESSGESGDDGGSSDESGDDGGASEETSDDGESPSETSDDGGSPSETSDDGGSSEDSSNDEQSSIHTSLRKLFRVDKNAQLEAREFLSAIMAESVTSFLEKQSDELEQFGVTKERFRNAYIAKNQIFVDCTKDDNISGIGFRRSREFKILQEYYPMFVVQLPGEQNLKASASKEPRPGMKSDASRTDRSKIGAAIVSPLDSEVRIVTVIVSSPNWVQDGRSWIGNIDSNLRIEFSIADEDFWKHVNEGSISTKINDKICVQWISMPDSSFRVLKVLTYNEETLAQPLQGADLKRVLG